MNKQLKDRLRAAVMHKVWDLHFARGGSLLVFISANEMGGYDALGEYVGVGRPQNPDGSWPSTICEIVESANHESVEQLMSVLRPTFVKTYGVVKGQTIYDADDPRVSLD